MFVSDCYAHHHPKLARAARILSFELIRLSLALLQSVLRSNTRLYLLTYLRLLQVSAYYEYLWSCMRGLDESDVRRLQAASCKLQATSYKLQATS